jgi:hypothetical protein
LEPAEAVFRKARVLAPGDQSILLWLIETNIKANDTADVDRYVSKLAASTPGNQLISYLENNFNDPYLQPSSKSIIIQKVERRLAKNSTDITEP